MSSEFQSIALPKDYTKCLTQEEVALVTRVLNSQYTRAGIDPEAKDELLERLRFSMSTEEYIGDVSKYRKISPQGCLSILDKLISPRTSALTVAELSKLPKFCDFTGRLTTLPVWVPPVWQCMDPLWYRDVTTETHGSDDADKEDEADGGWSVIKPGSWSRTEPVVWEDSQKLVRSVMRKNLKELGVDTFRTRWCCPFSTWKATTRGIEDHGEHFNDSLPWSHDGYDSVVEVNQQLAFDGFMMLVKHQEELAEEGKSWIWTRLWNSLIGKEEEVEEVIDKSIPTTIRTRH